MTGGERNVKQ